MILLSHVITLGLRAWLGIITKVGLKQPPWLHYPPSFYFWILLLSILLVLWNIMIREAWIWLSVQLHQSLGPGAVTTKNKENRNLTSCMECCHLPPIRVAIHKVGPTNRLLAGGAQKVHLKEAKYILSIYLSFLHIWKIVSTNQHLFA